MSISSKYSSETRFSSFLIFVVFFFNYLGYYAFILLVGDLSGLEASRSFTIPVRIVILSSLFLLIMIQKGPFNSHKINRFFVFFVLVYLLRLFIDLNRGRYYYMSLLDVFLYFLSFCVFPYILLSKVTLNEISLKNIFRSLLYSGFLFSSFVLIFYGEFIGQVSRLGKGTVDSLVLNPLALSYSSVLIIGTFVFYLLHNKINKVNLIIALASVVLSVIPFFLGASRGSLIAIAASILVYFFSRNSFKNFFSRLFLIVIIIGGLIYLDNLLGSGLLDRFLNTSHKFEETGLERLIIWKSAFNQFLNHPILGDKLAVDGWESYAHSIFFEILQTTGLLGFIPLLVLFSYIWSKVFYIAKNHRKYYWVAVIFIQSFFQNLFSGAIYNSSWLWLSTALVLVLYKYIKDKKI